LKFSHFSKNVFILIHHKGRKTTKQRTSKRKTQLNLTKIQNILLQFNIKKTLKTVKSFMQIAKIPNVIAG